MFNLFFNSHGLKTFPPGRFTQQRKFLNVKTGGGSGCHELLRPSIVSDEVPAEQTRSKDTLGTSICFPLISMQGIVGDGGHCEPTCVISSSTWSLCSHPSCLNALFNSFLNILCPAIARQRICCMTRGKLYKILTSVSLPQLEQSQCSDCCPPALSSTHKSK